MMILMMMNQKIISPPKPHPISNTDSGLTLALIMSGEAYRDASTSSTNDEGSINSLNSDVFSVNYHIPDHVLL